MPIPRDLAFSVEEFRDRLSRVRERLRDRGEAGLIVFSAQNIYYLTGMDTETMYVTQALVVPVAADPVLVLHEFELGRAENTCWLETIETFLRQTCLPML